MKNTLLLILFLTAQIFLRAQDYPEGKLLDAAGAERSLFYDRTQVAINKDTYRSVYKVMDKAKKILYTVTVTHNRAKTFFAFIVKGADGETQNFNGKYDGKNCGLIFNDRNNMDTAFASLAPYNYVLSFNDTKRDYPILHKVNAGGMQIMLDPITKLRVKKHVQELMLLPGFEVSRYDQDTKQPDKFPHENFITLLQFERKQLIKKDTAVAAAFAANKKAIQVDIAQILEVKKVSLKKKKYGGEKVNNVPHGRGVLVENTGVYDGTFKDGVFQSGKAYLRNDVYEYWGEYAGVYFNGSGYLKYNTGSYYGGNFVNGNLVSGVSFYKNKGEDTYFGNIANGKRNGYGELRDIKGGVFCGEYKNGVLIKGYSKETDPFGYVTYSIIDNGTKSIIDQQIVKKFFDSLVNLKK